MWHSPNQKVRSQKKRDRTRKSIHIRRINAQIEQPNQPDPKNFTNIRVVLNDLTVKGVGIFSSIALLPGQEITLHVAEPIKISIPSKVVWCQDQAVGSHILSNQPYSFRIGLEFITPPERESELKTYCENLAKEYL